MAQGALDPSGVLVFLDPLPYIPSPVGPWLPNYVNQPFPAKDRRAQKPPGRPMPAPKRFQDGSKNLHEFLTPLGNRFGPIWDPILAPKLAHVGLNFGSCFALVFKNLFEAFLNPSWSRFGVQVGGPKVLKVCNCRRFYAFRASAPEVGSGAFWGPSWGRFGGQVGPPNGSKKGPR